MKMAISCKEKSKNAVVDPRFGRALYFCIYDTETDAYDFIDNQQTLISPSGAGVQAASHLTNAGVSVLLTGHCGPNAFRALRAANMKIYHNVSGTLTDVINAFQKGKLTPASEADVEGHWV